MNLLKTEGWIVVNYGIAVFPTLSMTRREAIDKWNTRGDGYWRKLQRKGAIKCLKVSLERVQPGQKP